MKEVTPLLEQYNGLVNVIMNTDYSPQEYLATEKKLVSTLTQLSGKLRFEHLENIIKITQVLNTEALMIPMAKAISNINSEASFNYLLEQFLDCFENGFQKNPTADACYQAMLKLDEARVEREGINFHPYFL